MRVIVVNGRVFRVDTMGAIRISFSRIQLLSFCLFSILVALFNPPMYGLELPLLGTFLYWLVICYLVTGLWLLQFWLFDVQRRVTGLNLPVFAPLIVATSIIGMVWSSYGVTVYLFDLPPSDPSQVWLAALRYFAMAMVIEIVTVALVLPRFAHVTFETPLTPHAARSLAPVVSKDPVPPAQTRVLAQVQPPVAPKPLPRNLTVNDKTIPLSRLLWMKSVEHYVEFHCDTDSLTERAALRDLVDQAAGWDGIQPHRSWWVSRRAVDRMTRRSGNPVLILTDGTEVPVSRHRKSKVETWLSDPTALQKAG